MSDSFSCDRARLEATPETRCPSRMRHKPSTQSFVCFSSQVDGVASYIRMDLRHGLLLASLMRTDN